MMRRVLDGLYWAAMLAGGLALAMAVQWALWTLMVAATLNLGAA